MKTGVIEPVAFDNGALSSGELVGDGTIPYPGSEMNEPEVAETVNDTLLGKLNPIKRLDGDAAVPEWGISGLLDCKIPEVGCVRAENDKVTSLVTEDNPASVLGGAMHLVQIVEVDVRVTVEMVVVISSVA